MPFFDELAIAIKAGRYYLTVFLDLGGQFSTACRGLTADFDIWAMLKTNIHRLSFV